MMTIRPVFRLFVGVLVFCTQSSLLPMDDSIAGVSFLGPKDVAATGTTKYRVSQGFLQAHNPVQNTPPQPGRGSFSPIASSVRKKLNFADAGKPDHSQPRTQRFSFKIGGISLIGIAAVVVAGCVIKKWYDKQEMVDDEAEIGKVTHLSDSLE